MSTAPRGMSIQEGYRLYREQALFVNRRYQRKLVWTESEKARLIESILKGFPIPLILLAARAKTTPPTYEIIDGLQRLNAIFSYVDNAFPVGKQYFDVEQFARAKQLSDGGVFAVASSGLPRLSAKECADLLDYQLAVTIYATTNQTEITDVFGRINSGGKQLSDQEKRQAGLLTPFATFVRQLGAEIRGDASKDILALSAMPEISIDSKRARQNYGLTAEETFWCKQGVLRNSQLRDSEDEEMIADLASSLLLGSPIARSREILDELYDPDSDLLRNVENLLAVYSAPKLMNDMKVTFSVLRETIEAYSPEQNTLRTVVNPGSANPVKAAFYAIFMSFFDLVVKQQRSPSDPTGILTALGNLHADMITTAHYSKTEDRIKNIDKTMGLIQKFFVSKDPPAFTHGPGLALDFENSLRRSSIETGRYEFKQGLLRLDAQRAFDKDLVGRIIETICGIANIGPEAPGFVYIGVADNEADARRVSELDSVIPEKVGQRYVVGIDREARIQGITIEQYVHKIVGGIRASDLSEPLKSHVLCHIDTVDYRNKTVVRIVVPIQGEVAFVANDAFTRAGSSTEKVQGKGLLAVSSRFKTTA
jgi:hypothetical protein